MHRAACDLDSVWDQADGEPQRVAGAERSAFVEVAADEWAGGDLVFEAVLQGGVRTVHSMGVGEPVAGGFRKAARVAHRQRLTMCKKERKTKALGRCRRELDGLVLQAEGEGEAGGGWNAG